MKKKFDEPRLSTVEELTAALYKVGKELDRKNKLLAEQNKELEEKNELLINNEKSKSQMYSNLAHDLRSPIGAIRCATEYIMSMDEYDKDEIKETIDLIYNRTVSLERLIDDIFLLSRLDSNVIKFKKQKIAVRDFLEEFFYITICDIRYDKRNMRLNISESIDKVIEIDIENMSRVFDNLFTNACKYSNEGDTIELGVYERKKGYIDIYVKDTGIGIEEKDIEKIFERSYMVSDSRTPEKENSFGIGLAIVKEIVKKHGGKVWCESVYGEGTEIIVRVATKE